MHLDVRGNTLFRNKIRFVCMKLGCGLPQEGIEPSTYRCFEEDLSDVQSGCSTTELQRHGGLSVMKWNVLLLGIEPRFPGN